MFWSKRKRNKWKVRWLVGLCRSLLRKNRTELIFALRAFVSHQIFKGRKTVPSAGGSARGAILHNVIIGHMKTQSFIPLKNM